MFTGIIEGMGMVQEVKKEGANLHFYLECPFTSELKVDQSLAHNGVCLTVVEKNQNRYKVTAIHETLLKTNLQHVHPGQQVNLERCMPAHGRFDGHIVQGHVDTTGTCESVISEDGSLRITISHPVGNQCITVEKGSICVNGVSLTVVNSQNNRFEVCLIPYTATHTNLGQLKPGDVVNLEFDIIGKYMQKIASLGAQ